MKAAFRKNLSLALTVILIVCACGLFSYKKQGMFVDEIYTYGLSNGYYTPFVISIPENGVTGNVISAAEMNDYLTVGQGDAFAFGSVYYNQAQDVHPPLYYWLFNIASSLAPGVFSKWTGLILDGILYALVLLVLYKLATVLFGSHAVSTAAVDLYGLSSMGISTMLMIRMYVLLTLLSLTLALLIAKLMKSPSKKLYPLIALNILAGLMTQYYFVFYAFFACLAYFIYALCRREWKALILFTLWAFAGVAALPIVFPPFISQLFSDNLVSGSTAVDNISNLSLYVSRSIGFCRTLIHSMKAVVLAGAAAFLLCLVCAKKLAAKLKADKALLLPLIVILPAVAVFPVVAIVSPVPEARYIYNLAPFFALAAAWLFSLCEEFFSEKAGYVLLALLLCLSAYMLRSVSPEYIYPEHAVYNSAVEPYAHVPCVYFGDDTHNGPLTQDLLQLMRFDDVFLAEDEMSPALLDYIDSHSDNDTLVIYISTSKDWGSAYDAEEIIALIEGSTDYSAAEVLYSYGLSETYVLTK